MLDSNPGREKSDATTSRACDENVIVRIHRRRRRVVAAVSEGEELNGQLDDDEEDPSFSLSFERSDFRQSDILTKELEITQEKNTS